VEQLSALIFEAVRLVLVQILINSKGMKMNPFQSLYYVSPACFFSLLIPFCTTELPILMKEFGEEFQFRPLILLANGFLAFFLNLAVFLLIGKTSALTMNIAGVIKDWMLIGWSQYLFKAPVTGLQLIGYTVAFLGVGFHNYQKLQQMKKMSTSKGHGGDKEGEDTPPPAKEEPDPSKTASPEKKPLLDESGDANGVAGDAPPEDSKV